VLISHDWYAGVLYLKENRP